MVEKERPTYKSKSGLVGCLFSIAGGGIILLGDIIGPRNLTNLVIDIGIGLSIVNFVRRFLSNNLDKKNVGQQ